jgi:NAD(P)H-quinone oxidoreductase subunit 5
MVETFIHSVWLIPCYGIVGMLFALPWFPGVIRRTGPRPSGYVNLLMTLLGFAHSIFTFVLVWGKPPQTESFTWLEAANLKLNFGFEISSLSVGALVLITGLNFLSQIFAIGYLEMDWGWARLFALLGLFEAGMAALVLCDNLFFSYCILEILTLGTYLLVGFWFNQSLVVSGARDAFLTKRIGDLLLLMGVIALLPLAGSWNYHDLERWAATANINPTLATLIGLALISGPIGKCAQFPLHLWLDEAMEGPLPATILRNSLVVTTGAWILVKISPILALSPVVLGTLIVIGSISAVGGSLIAIAQIDIKRALSFLVSAYLGLVFIAVGIGQPQEALLLILTFSLSMALLVMSAGGIIWNCVTQDLTQFGGLWSRRPISAIAFLVGAVGLVAFPPLGSFWAFLKLAAEVSPWLVGLLLVVNTLTAFGLGRVFGLIFAGSTHPMTERAPEVHWPMMVPTTLLTGFVLHLPIVLWQVQLLPVQLINTALMPAVALSASSIFGGIAGFRLRLAQLPWPGVQEMLARDFYTGDIYRWSVVFVVAQISQIVSIIDRYVVDGLVNLVGYFSLLGGESLKYSTNGKTQFYALTILLGVVAMGCAVAMHF